MIFFVDDWCRCRCCSDGDNRCCWLCNDILNCCWSWSRSRSGSPIGEDGLDKDILHIDNISLDNSLDHCRLITPMVDMGKGVAQLQVRMGKGASAEDERDGD